MAYKKRALHVTRLTGITRYGLEHNGPAPEGTIWLEHSCDEWVIGSATDARRLWRDLRDAMARSRTILATPKKGLLKRALEHGWNYYCPEHKQGFVEYYGPGGLIEHGVIQHCQTGEYPPDWFLPRVKQEYEARLQTDGRD